MISSRTAPLAALLGALAVLDLLVVAHIAGAADEAESPAPKTLPDQAFLTGRDRPSTEVQGVRARIEPAVGSYRLLLTNASAQAREVDLEVVCYQRSGSPMSRMGVRREQVAVDRVVVTLAAGASTEQKLGCAPPEAPGSPEGSGLGGLLFDNSFSTTDFELFATSDRERVRTWTPKGKRKYATRPAPARPLATLRLSRDLETRPARPLAAATADLGQG